MLAGGGGLLVLGSGILSVVVRNAIPGGGAQLVDYSGLVLLQMAGVVSFFAWVAAVAISVSLISQDLDSGAVVSIFSKPVSRLAYALGKLIAAVLALLLIILILGIGTQLVVLINGGGHEGSVLQTFLLI